MILVSSLQFVQQRIQQIPVRLLQNLLNIILVVLCAWLLARVSWSLIPVPGSEPLLPIAGLQTATASAGDKDTNLTALLQFSLFGKQTDAPIAEPEPEPVVVTEAPKTRLNVKLTGIVAVRQQPERSSAIIENRGTEITYAVGETIEGTSAVLKEVHADRVLLQQAGRYETLMLEGIEDSKIAQANAGLGRSDDSVVTEEPVTEPAPVEAAENLPAPPVPQEERRNLSANPAQFFDYIRITPQNRNGQLVGYRLAPGRDPSVFNQAGLQRNDLAIEINGIPLTDMQQARNVINELRDAKEASLRIERNGEIRDILLNLSQ